MLPLQFAINKAHTVAEFGEIFSKNVQVRLNWFSDSVTIEGYEGAVTTDFIASKIMRTFDWRPSDEKKQLARLIANKVFLPLRELVEAPENQCLPYQLIALKRVTFTPPAAPEFGNSIALKHAMVIGCLDGTI